MKNNTTDFAVVISKAIVVWFWTVVFGACVTISFAFISSTSALRGYIGSFIFIIGPLIGIGLFLFYNAWRELLQSLPLVLRLLRDIILEFSGSSAPVHDNNEEKTGSPELVKGKSILEENEEVVRSKSMKFPTQMMGIFRSLFYLIVLIVMIRIIQSIFEVLARGS
jgi:hypothetical protein